MLGHTVAILRSHGFVPYILHPSRLQDMLVYCIFSCRRGDQTTDPLQEFDSVESAQEIMESDLRYQFDLDGVPLRLDYSHAAQPAAAASASASSDWICPGCSAVNFSRWVCSQSTSCTFMYFLPYVPQLSGVWLCHAPQLDMS